MEIVLLTALGVGGATVLGAALGFAFKKVSYRFSDIVLGFAREMDCIHILKERLRKMAQQMVSLAEMTRE